MHKFTIEARFSTGEFRGHMTVPADNAYEALCSVRGLRTWANGYTDFETGIVWPFNPEMTIDGIRAADVFAAKVAEITQPRAAESYIPAVAA